MKQFNVRLPDDLHARLKKLAAHEHRSLNSQIVALLERAVRDARIHPHT